MLFNSYSFIFLYLPVTALVFFLLAGSGRRRAAIGWLALASLAFYAWWNPIYLPLLLGSIAFNFTLGRRITLHVVARRNEAARRWLVLGVVANLLLLGYYKYAAFLLDSFNAVLGTALPPADIVLPLGISFFTFTQLAYLVDAYEGKAREYDVANYGLFVTFFPHLIAGPILHHRQMMPQFDQVERLRFNWSNLGAGLAIFVLGLGKKVLIADEIAGSANPVFEAAARGEPLGAYTAWCGALAYTLQLYFDFSGYSDMAIGLSRMLGIQLPVNFWSPYKARSIIEFWRRWHITLSHFLRDYLYIPLGGNRHGPARRYLNLMLTMLLGGLWHGAGWTFVLWGGLHGAYLCVNHGWHAFRERFGLNPFRGRVGGALAFALTFFAVVFAWVLFRAESWAVTRTLWSAMAGANGLGLPSSGANAALMDDLKPLLIGLLLLWVWTLPNLLEVCGVTREGTWEQPRSRLALAPNRRWALGLGLLFALVVLSLSRPTEFLYFQF